ncbi:MAG: hypothetical protein RSD74_02000 [Angelakisella sp.]
MPFSLNKAKLAIYSLPKNELVEIYYKLNSWQWDERLGEKPDGWEMLPMYNCKLIHKIMKRRTRSDYITPLFKAVSYIAKAEIEAAEIELHTNAQKQFLKTSREKTT